MVLVILFFFFGQVGNLIFLCSFCFLEILQEDEFKNYRDKGLFLGSCKVM